jgi:hypothetical protein
MMGAAGFEPAISRAVKGGKGIDRFHKASGELGDPAASDPLGHEAAGAALA